MKPVILPSAALAAILSTLLWAQSATPTPQASAPTPEAETAPLPLSADKKLLIGKLDNGLSYIIRPTREPAGRGSVRLFVDVGSLHEVAENSGISHFLEHMVFNGSRTFKRGELIPAMQKLGLGFGGDANAYTSLLQTVYMLDLPNLEDKTVDFALTIMRDFADGATLENEAIDHERGIVVSEMKSRDSASYRAMIGMLDQLTEGTRVARFMPIGREEVILNAPYQAVRDYYRNHYVPNRMTLIITGDFAPQEAEKWVKKHFESMQPREAAPMPPLGTLKQADATLNKLISNTEQADCDIIISTVRPYQHKEDTLEQRIEDLPLKLAMTTLNRRLSRLARQADSPFIAAQADQDELFRAAEVTGLTIKAEPSKWQQALELGMQQLRQVIAHGFDPSELHETISGYQSNLQQACDTWETKPAKDMATRLVAALSNRSAMTDPAENMRIAQLGLQRVMADPDLCRRALEEAFDLSATPSARLTLMGTLPEGITEEQLRAAYEQTLQAEVPAPTPTVTKPFAYETIGMPGTTVKQGQIADLGITTLTLSNGVKVNLKPIDFRRGSISVSAAVDGGIMSLPLTPGLPMMVNSVMQRGGLREHSMDELERLLASHRVSLNFGMGQTRFFFSGNTNMKDLELQCKLLAAAILHPGYREEGEIILRRKLDNRYKAFTTKADGVYAMKMPRALFGDDTRFVIPRQEEVEARSTREVQEVLEPLLQNNALEVSLVGDFKVEDVLPILERTFGAMPQRKEEFSAPSEADRHVDFRPWGQREFLTYPTELDKTIVAQAYPAGNGRDYRRVRRLQVLASLVREKLFDGLRAVMGESYSPRVLLYENKEFDNAAYIVTTSEGVKGNRAKVNAAMESICRGIGQGQISREDFDCAIRPFIARAEKSLISPEFWAEGMQRLQSNPQSEQSMRDLLKDTRNITWEEIRDLGKEIFGNENVNFYFIVPDDYMQEQENADPQAPAEEEADTPTQTCPAPGEYAVVTTSGTAEQADWKRVADTLVQKYEGASLIILPEINENNLAEALRKKGARYAALVLRPEEVDRVLVNKVHRATRKLDDDPYGDCLWGIVTGYRAEDAQRMAEARKPLVIRRVLGTTNVDASRFEHSYCITDWEGFPVLEQQGYTKPTTTTYTMETPEGQDVLENGLQGKFAEQLSSAKPQFIVTSSHATQFNLEMPFSKGLIFSANNRFYLMSCKQMPIFGMALQPALEGKTAAMPSLAEALQATAIQPDGTDRVWLACGNCLIGDARGTDQSMVITALSAYRCNQFVGYTVPSWYGEAGWGTLGLFMGNTDGTTLAEAFFFNNQFILEKTLRINPKLMDIQFNEEKIGPALQRDFMNAHITVHRDYVKDSLGLVHDRDTFAFYGDPAWAAVVDYSQAHAPLSLRWDDDLSFTLTAHYDYTGRAAVWFPRAEIGKMATGCDLKDAVFTNDFILIPSLTLKAGESITIRLIIPEEG